MHLFIGVPCVRGWRGRHVKEVQREAKGEKARRQYKVAGKGRDVLKDHEKFRSEWLEGVSQLREM